MNTHSIRNQNTDSQPTSSDYTSLYSAEPHIQIRAVSGRFAKIRLACLSLLLLGFYGLPWLSINGQPALLLDIAERRFYILGSTFVPQDMIYLTGLLIISALGLFFVTTIAGRVFCGYACPQTVFTQLFSWTEWAIEGDRPKRIKLDQSRWDMNKWLRRGGKHLAWITLAAFTGLTFVAYFVPATTLFHQLWQLELSGWALFWALFYGFATWGNAGFLREQVCKYMCPYARFQSVMFDRDTLLIGYQQPRGEPRKQKRIDPADQGDCIDCTLCVQVCPTGIDIRNGLQYECIACAACIDACDEVMDKIGKPRGLIRYSTGRQENGGRLRLLRPRSIAYGLILGLLITGFITALALRSELELDVHRDRQQLYTELANGQVRNSYQLHITNKRDRELSLSLTAAGDGNTEYAGDFQVIPASTTLPPLGSVHLAANVIALPTKPWQAISLRLADHSGQTLAVESTSFIGPQNPNPALTNGLPQRSPETTP